MTKVCNKCNEQKTLNEFFKDKNNKTNGRYSICKSCKMAASLIWRANNRTKYNSTQKLYHKKHYERLRLQRYNITPAQRDAMLATQNNVCAICEGAPKGKRPLVVDHNPHNGVVRGLLCYGCNRAIAILDNEKLYKISKNYIQMAKEHITKHCQHPNRVDGSDVEIWCYHCRKVQYDEEAA